MWVQAEDSPPHEYFGDYSIEQLQTLKEKWLQPSYHSRKTDGILSLFPCVFDMPCKVTSGKGTHFKEYGLHNGCRCCLKAVSLHAEDEARLRANGDDEVVLEHLPEALWIEVEG